MIRAGLELAKLQVHGLDAVRRSVVGRVGHISKGPGFVADRGRRSLGVVTQRAPVFEGYVV